jgi:cbb3-type cytochrome oxidase subunit 3
MSLTEIMSNAGLSRYAEIALLLFFAAFLLILWRIFRPGRRKWFEQQARLPLDDDPDATPRSPRSPKKR